MGKEPTPYVVTSYFIAATMTVLIGAQILPAWARPAVYGGVVVQTDAIVGNVAVDTPVCGV